VDAERSNLYWKLNYAGERSGWREKDGEETRLVFSENQIGKCHLWLDSYLPVPGGFYCSNAFAEAALAADFSGLSLTPREEA